MKKILILLLISKNLQAQTLHRQVIPAAGESTNPRLQWTLGEPVAGIAKGGSATIFQGFQQPRKTTQANCQISGKITTESGKPIPNVQVTAASSTSTTDANGDFCLQNLPSGIALTITPTRNDNPKNGLTSGDLLLIQKHLLNQQLLPSPYKIIAADCNKNFSVTAADILVAQRVLLNLDNTFPNGNPSWRFVPQNFVFQNGQNPFSPVFPENIQITLTAQNPSAVVNFFGIKVGDANGTATP